MQKRWLLIILALSLGLMLIQKSEDSLHLQRFMSFQKTLKLKHFSQVKPTLSPENQDLLEIWESMLTGNTRPLNKLIKENFSRLGLRHLFTPSGLHLSSLLYPSMKIIKGQRSQFILLTLLALFFLPLSDFAALKRMVMVKWFQKLIGFKEGFGLALILDVLFGTFQSQALSFTYSFLFLGIMYSGVKGMGRIFWFFIGQCLISFSQGVFITPLLLIFSPLLSFGFVLAMPVLFLLSFPLWSWQLEMGLFILKGLIQLITLCAQITVFIPAWEMHIGVLVLLFIFTLGKWRILPVGLLFLSSSLNLDLARNPSLGTYEWIPQGEILKIEETKEKMVIRYRDGKCERMLVRGMWWEKCSPRRGSRKKLRKLSYPSSETQKSSLRG